MSEEWVAVQDPNSGRTYYANLRTRETRWERPAGYVDSSARQLTYQSESVLSSVNDQPSVSSFYGGQSMSNFNQQQDPYASQSSFYGQQQQQPPQQQSFYGQQQGAPPQHQQVPSYSSSSYLGSEQQQGMNGTRWRKAHDPNTGKDYYYHMDTKETQWTVPEELAGNQQSMEKRLSAQMAATGMMGAQSVTNFQTQAWESDDDDDDEEQSGSDSWGDDDDDKDESSSEDDGLQVFDSNAKAKQNYQTNVIDVSDSDSNDDVKAFNPIGEDEDVVVQDDSNKYWVIGETQGPKYEMLDYADKHFQKEKHKKGMFKKMALNEMIQWCSYKKMSNALRKLDSKLNSQAKQTWKNINSYMGDRKSSKGSSGHVDKLLRFALKAPEELRDEIYCQLVKQTTKNMKAPSLKKGWKLLCICCSVFPPSDEFACYLAAYLFKNTKEPGDVGEFASFALKALDRTMEVGQRRTQPTPDEIQRIEQREPISVKINFLDGSFRTLLVTCQTRSAQIENAIAQAYGMQHPESFGLFEMEEPKPGWAQAVYQRREGMERQSKIDDLQNMPYDRELEMNERIMDVMASWKRSKRKQNKQIRFVYKCKLHSKAQESSYSKQGWKVAFITSVWHVQHGLYVVDEKLAFQLAAIQLQATFGPQDHGFYQPGIIIDSVPKFFPWQIRNKYSRVDELEHKILERHGQYKKLDKIDAYRKYIELLRKEASPQYFGNVFFRCVRVSRLKKQKKDEQDDLVIGISENGVVFLNPLTLKIIERYKMEEILTYGFRSNAFLFVAGTLMTQRKYQFATMLGKQMNDLLRAHIDLRVQQAEIQGYNIAQ